MKYVDFYYPESKLLGELAKIWGVRSFNAANIASDVPTTSVLTITFNTFLDSCPIVSKIFKLLSLCLSCFLSLSYDKRIYGLHARPYVSLWFSGPK